MNSCNKFGITWQGRRLYEACPCCRLRAERDRLRDAPTDSGIPELDGLCKQFNDGEIGLIALVCRVWNKAYSLGRTSEEG